MIKGKIEVLSEDVIFTLTITKSDIFENQTRLMLFNQMEKNKYADNYSEELNILTEIVKEIELDN